MYSSTTCGCETTACSLGILERPRYFARQLITPAELNLESAYFAERLRRHNRMLHGFGVVCGAQVCRIPSADGTGAEPWKVKIRTGYVIDGYGNEVSIGGDRIFDLRSSGVVVMSGDPEGELSDPWCSDVWTDRPPERIWLAVCHKESLARPVRVQPAGCGCDDTSCEYSRWQDGYELRALTERPSSCDVIPPTSDDFLAALTGPLRECPPCPPDPCVVLAQVDIDADGNITAIDNCSCRRNVVSLTELWWRCAGLATTISGVTVKPKNPAPGTPGVTVTVSGTNLSEGATIDLGPGITVKGKNVSGTAKTLTVTVDIAADATAGERALTITNPDCSLVSWPAALTVSASG